MKKLLITIGAVIAAIGTATAADVASVTSSADQSVTTYDSLQTAINASSAGDTVTLLTDHYWGDFMYIGRENLTIDLNGYNLSHGGGNFFRLGGNDSGLTIKDGTISYTWEGGATFWVDGEGLSDVVVTNCYMDGECLVYGNYGEINFIDCWANSKYLVSNSGASGLTVRFISGVYAPYQSATPQDTYSPNVIEAYGGYYNFDATPWAAYGFSCVKEDHDYHDLDTTYAIYEAAEAPSMVDIIGSDGTFKAGYANYDFAMAAAQDGDTLLFHTSFNFNSARMIDVPNLTIDLNGFSLTMNNGGGDFLDLRANATGLTIKNGSLNAVHAVFHLHECEGLGDVTVENCTLTGECSVFGRYGTITYKDCIILNDHFTSSSNGSGMKIVVAGESVVAPTQPLNLGLASLAISGGYFNFNPSSFVVDGYTMQGISEVHAGRTCLFKVYLPSVDTSVVDVVSADGSVTNGFAGLGAALESLTGGETIVFNRSISYGGESLTIGVDATFDLNGFQLDSSARDFLAVAEGRELTIKNGNVVKGGYGSVFLVNNGSLVNLDNCYIQGNCMVYGAGQGMVKVSDGCEVFVDCLGSSNGSAQVEVNGGKCTINSNWRDGADQGTYFYFNGGTFNRDPHGIVYCQFADGLVKVLDGGYISLMNEETAKGTAEAYYNGLYYMNLQAAFEYPQPGETLYMINDVNRQVGSSRSFILDLGGHTLSYTADIFELYQCEFTITNGTIRMLESGQSCFKMSGGVTLTLTSDVSIEGTDGKQTNGFYVPGSNTIVFDGASVSTSGIFSPAGTLNGTTVLFKGDGVYPNSIGYPGAGAVDPSVMEIRGGWWNDNPTAYVKDMTNYKIKDFGENYVQSGVPCRYHVYEKPKGLVISVK